MRTRRAPAAVLGLGVGLLVAGFVAGRSASAGEVLGNPGFDVWSGGSPEGWATTGALTRTTAGCRAGACAVVTGSGSLSQTVAVAPRAPLEASTYAAAAGGPASASLQLIFLDASFVPLALQPTESSQTPPGGFTRLTLAVSAPAGAAYVTFVVRVEGPADGEFLVDSASLLADDPPPSGTPEPPADTPTPEPTETSIPPATATPVKPSPTPIRTPTPTAPRPSTATPSPRPEDPATPAPTATSPPRATATPRPGPAPAPVPPPAGGSGGLLVDGDFEFVSDGAPAFWDHFGGLLSSEPESVSGSWSALLLSDSGATKWLTQAFPVEGAAWYAGSAWGRVAGGEAELFIRVSWYASVDGSGAAIEQDDGGVSVSTAWSALTFGPTRSPSTARSARFRLMLRPGPGAAALFDDARFVPASAPAATPTPAPTPTPAASTSATPGPGATPTLATQAAGTPTRTPAATASRTGTTAGRSGGSNASGAAAGPSAGVASGAGLRLTEVLVDPAEAGRDNGFEWVEVRNDGPEPVDLTGWRVGDSRTADVLPSLVVAPGEYVVIAGSDASFPDGVRVVRLADGTIGSGLNNDGDAVRLIDPSGAVVDSVSFGEDKTAGPRASRVPGPGETLGLDDAGGWRVTTRPTPGSPNVLPPLPAATAEPGGGGPNTATASSGTAATPAVRPLVDVTTADEGGSRWLWTAALVAAAGIGFSGVGYWAGQRRKQGKDGD
ncbi:MAG: lamin tail domain-containing protein [Dehalococcoidia bacterium]